MNSKIKSNAFESILKSISQDNWLEKWVVTESAHHILTLNHIETNMKITVLTSKNKPSVHGKIGKFNFYTYDIEDEMFEKLYILLKDRKSIFEGLVFDRVISKLNEEN